MKRPTHANARHLLLLVPLTWPGFLYGLWQRRLGLWWSKPRAWVGQGWQQVSTHPFFVPYLMLAGVMLAVSASIYGAVVYVGPWMTSLLTPAVHFPAGGGDVIAAPDFLTELGTVMTSVWIPLILIGHLVGLLVMIGTGFVRLSAGMTKIIVVMLLGGVGVSGLMSLLGLPGLK